MQLLLKAEKTRCLCFCRFQNRILFFKLFNYIPNRYSKIDKSFISDMKKGKKNEALFKAIINLSQNLGLEVIVEGVEDHSQEQFLIDNNCKKFKVTCTISHFRLR